MNWWTLIASNWHAPTTPLVFVEDVGRSVVRPLSLFVPHHYREWLITNRCESEVELISFNVYSLINHPGYVIKYFKQDLMTSTLTAQALVYSTKWCTRHFKPLGVTLTRNNFADILFRGDSIDWTWTDEETSWQTDMQTYTNHEHEREKERDREKESTTRLSG